jgi:hypothetical protein
MKIDKFVPPASPIVARGTVHTGDVDNSGYPPLSRRDVEVIRQATGMFFNWPPREDEGFPGVAMEVALERMRQEAAGQPWNGVDADTLRNLRRLGLITQEGMNKGMDALSKPSGASSSAGLPTVHEAALAAANHRSAVSDPSPLYL